MAYDKIIVIHSRLDRCLDYVQNDGKTDLGDAVDYICNPIKAGFQTAINCTLDKSFLQMQETKRRWDKHGGILGYHIIHSYAPGEVTPEQAHEAGVEFARRLLGDKYEAVVCTHTDRDHLHCHIVFNGRFFKIFIYTAIAPLPLASFAGEATSRTGQTFLRSYVGVCMEGAVIVLSCVIYSAFLSGGSTALDESLPAVTMVWQYIGQLMFNMLVLTGLVKGSDRLVHEMLGA